ncbi:MAG TPA: Holliday junction resolvase RuvX [Sedimentisphaerales bacterium]|nr:Holliday junction resolvase RuvX [Sedimentisphaerales bacterium]
MRYLAIDYGRKRTGLAICDRLEIIASPLAVIDTPKQFISRIIEVVSRENADAVVLGLPLNMDGSVGPQAELVMKFANKLKQHLQIPVHFQDERLTTFSAEQESLARGVRKKKNKRKPLDAVAAAEILQDFLDAKKNP